MKLGLSKQDGIRIGVILLIAFFFFEFFWPVLYAPIVHASATPTPEPKQFMGRGQGIARIDSFADSVFVSCNKTGLENDFGALPGVSSAFAVQAGSYFIALNDSSAVASVVRLADAVCEPARVLRSAVLYFEGQVQLFNQANYSDAPKNVSNRELAAAFRLFGGRDVVGFVDARARKNESVMVNVVIQFLDEKIVDKPLLEELPRTLPTASPTVESVNAGNESSTNPNGVNASNESIEATPNATSNATANGSESVGGTGNNSS